MKVLLSYSGSQSMGVAEALRKLIGHVLPNARPWMASLDIQPGARWQQVLDDTLRETRFAVICLTRENRSSPWLFFEAGAIAAKANPEKKIYPLAIDFGLNDLPGPLTQFQGVKCDRENITKILHDLNKELCSHSQGVDNLDEKLSRHLDDFISQISGGWISWDIYWEKQNGVVQVLQRVLHENKYEPDLLVGISNGGLHFADTVHRRVYENRKPILALWANRQNPNSYFDNGLNNSFFEGRFMNEIIDAACQHHKIAEILILDDVVGTTTTFRQLIKYLENRLPKKCGDSRIRFMFLYTQAKDLPQALIKHLLTEDDRCKNHFQEVRFQHWTMESKLPYLKDISTGGVITRR